MQKGENIMIDMILRPELENFCRIFLCTNAEIVLKMIETDLSDRLAQ